MLRIRLVEEKIVELYPKQEMRCPVHLSIGQEAAAVGACAALGPRDYALSAHRSHAHYLAKGGDLKAMMAEIYGKATGCCRGRGGSMHLIDGESGFVGATPIVGATIPIAVGTAFASMLRGEPRVSVAFLGDAAVETGAFHESASFAALKKLPVVFLCENNLFSVYSPLSVRQPAGREIFEMARGQGMASVQGDGNDVEEVLRLSAEAARRARAGEGPSFIELKTYRWREHCGPDYDNHLGYRDEADAESWKKRCPLDVLKGRMLREGLAKDADFERLRVRISSEIEEAVRFALESPFPAPDELMDHIYAP